MFNRVLFVPDSLVFLFLIALLLLVALILRQQRQKQPVGTSLNQHPWQSLVEMAGSIIIGLSPDYRIVEWNQAAEQVYGWSREEIGGQDYLQVLPESIREEVASHLYRVLQEKTVHRFEHPVLTRQGEQRLLLWTITPWFKTPGEFFGIIVSGQDMTEHQQRVMALVEARDTALETSLAKSQFLAQMSHEIRTPLNAVLGMVELLLRTNLTTQQQDYTQTISSSAKHLLTVINNILDLSKLEAGEMHLEELEFDLGHGLSTVMDLMAAKAEEKGIELGILLDPALPRQVKGDSIRLRQILLNLLNNAIKFTEVGHVVIQATLQSATQDAIKIRFAVQDTGIGISPEFRSKLFQPFSQASAATTRQYGGTGLGLWICQQFVALMGGEIGVSSVFGEGSTFWFTVEFTPSETPQALPIPPEFSKLKLLVVDQSVLVRQSILNLIEGWGIKGDEADNSITALTAWQTAQVHGKPYDVILVAEDLLGQESGAFVRVMYHNSKKTRTKVILMSRIKQRQRAEQLLKLGHFSSLVKPITPSRLLNSLMSSFEPLMIHSDVLLTHLDRYNSFLQTSTPLHPVDKTQQPLKILLAEDDLINQQVILAQLSLLGHEADCVANGEAVLQQLGQHTYDIVLMDCQMPILNGYETTRLLREREGSDQHTIVIALTASAMTTDREKCLAVGMDDYVSKPVELEALATLLQRWTHPIQQKVLVLSSENGTRTSQVSPHVVESLPVSKTVTPIDSPIDIERLNQLFKGNPQHQQRLLYLFVKQANTRLTAIRQGITLTDFGMIQQHSHALKGSSANVGVRHIPELAERLEYLASQQCLEGVLELVEKLQSYLTQVQGFLDCAD